MGNPKTPHKSYIHVNYRNVTLIGIIKAIYQQFDFGDITNGSSNIDTTGNDNSTDGSGYISIILTNLSQRENVYPAYIRKVLSSPKQSTTHKMKELTIDGKMYHQVNTLFTCEKKT